MQKSFKRIRAGLDGHRSAPSDNTGQPPPHTQLLNVTGDAPSGLKVDVFHLVMPFTVGDEQSSTCVIQIEKLDDILEGETSIVTDSPVDEKSAGSDNKAFIQQTIVNETNVLVDEQSAGITHGSGNPVDGQSAGLTEEQQSSDAGTMVAEKVEGLDEDTLKKRFANTMDAILDQDDIDLGWNTLLEHKIDTGCAMPIKQFIRRMLLGIPTFHLKQGRKFHMAKEHVHFMKGGRRYSWDIPPDVGNKAVTFNDGVVQSSTVGGRKFSWD